MHRLSNANATPYILGGALVLLWMIVQFPTLSFAIVFGAWSALRWPHDGPTNPHADVGSAKNIPDAFYEGLWAAVLLVGGVTLIVQFLTDVTAGNACALGVCG